MPPPPKRTIIDQNDVPAEVGSPDFSPPFFVSVRTMARGFEVQASKVPEVTLGFWIIKILATTLGETGGDR
jgi:hypothetical protein